MRILVRAFANRVHEFGFFRYTHKLQVFFLRHDQNVNAIKGHTHVFMRSRIGDILLIYIKGMMQWFCTNQFDVHIYSEKQLKDIKIILTI